MAELQEGTAAAQSDRNALFSKPMNLIISEKKSDGKYCPAVNKKVIEQLKQVDKKIVVVACVGVYRTGKSYLLNRFSREAGGASFSVGHKSTSETKGMWLMLMDHPTLPDYKLALLDTEGIGDTAKGDQQYDAMLFVLTSLLSNKLIYNGKNAIEERDFEKFYFTTALSNYVFATIDGKESDGDGDVSRYFPELLYVVRDFNLMLEVPTSDEYLENALAVNADDDITSVRAKKRIAIKKNFPRRKCFTLEMPCDSSKKFQRLDKLADRDLNQSFVEEATKLYDHIANESQVGDQWNGEQLANLVEIYVNAYQNGEIPNVSYETENLKEKENKKALENAGKDYDEAMQKLVMPTESNDIILSEHQKITEKIQKQIMKKAILGEGEEEAFLTSLQIKLIAKRDDYERKNSDLSKTKCKETLQTLYDSIIKRDEYRCTAGFNKYREDMEKLEKGYKATSILGVMKDKVLNKFLEKEKRVADEILKTSELYRHEESKVVFMMLLKVGAVIVVHVVIACLVQRAKMAILRPAKGGVGTWTIYNIAMTVMTDLVEQCINMINVAVGILQAVASMLSLAVSAIAAVGKLIICNLIVQVGAIPMIIAALVAVMAVAAVALVSAYHTCHNLQILGAGF